MNLIALNFEDNCFFQAASDPAMLHAILYIVATEYDLRRGLPNSNLSSQHAIKAIQSINKKIESGIVTDSTAAAVSLLATREACNSRFIFFLRRTLIESVHRISTAYMTCRLYT